MAEQKGNTKLYLNTFLSVNKSVGDRPQLMKFEKVSRMKKARLEKDLTTQRTAAKEAYERAEERFYEGIVEDLMKGTEQDRLNKARQFVKKMKKAGNKKRHGEDKSPIINEFQNNKKCITPAEKAAAFSDKIKRCKYSMNLAYNINRHAKKMRQAVVNNSVAIIFIFLSTSSVFNINYSRLNM